MSVGSKILASGRFCRRAGQVTEFAAGEPEEAGQRDRRVQQGLGLADPRVAGDQLLLGGTQVGAYVYDALERLAIRTTSNVTPAGTRTSAKVLLRVPSGLTGSASRSMS